MESKYVVMEKCLRFFMNRLFINGRPLKSLKAWQRKGRRFEYNALRLLHDLVQFLSLKLMDDIDDMIELMEPPKRKMLFDPRICSDENIKETDEAIRKSLRVHDDLLGYIKTLSDNWIKLSGENAILYLMKYNDQMRTLARICFANHIKTCKTKEDLTERILAITKLIGELQRRHSWSDSESAFFLCGVSNSACETGKAKFEDLNDTIKACVTEFERRDVVGDGSCPFSRLRGWDLRFSDFIRNELHKGKRGSMNRSYQFDSNMALVRFFRNNCGHVDKSDEYLDEFESVPEGLLKKFLENFPFLIYEALRCFAPALGEKRVRYALGDYYKTSLSFLLIQMSYERTMRMTVYEKERVYRFEVMESEEEEVLQRLAYLDCA